MCDYFIFYEIEKAEAMGNFPLIGETEAVQSAHSDWEEESMNEYDGAAVFGLSPDIAA